MATTPSNLTRFQTSSPATRLQPGFLVTNVTPRRQSAPKTGSLFTLPKEPEDARLTGGTRSLDRRLLALNLSGSLAKSAKSALANGKLTLAKSTVTKVGAESERPAPAYRSAVA